MTLKGYMDDFMVNFHWLLPSLKGEACLKAIPVSCICALGSFSWNWELKAGSIKGYNTQKLSNLLLNLSRHASR